MVQYPGWFLRERKQQHLVQRQSGYPLQVRRKAMLLTIRLLGLSGTALTGLFATIQRRFSAVGILLSITKASTCKVRTGKWKGNRNVKGRLASQPPQLQELYRKQLAVFYTPLNIENPPSTTNWDPVTKRDASLNRNNKPPVNSSGSPNLFCLCWSSCYDFKMTWLSR